ncbi:unnamed protein product [Staurois parvus]|uniref:Uncharacterized protein n=1 Tax=Staurois parvus TaxID=386267 RepID=A0ABN9AHZ2_9NEOB|nr:unnamed protein product [Staurois parvus]
MTLIIDPYTHTHTMMVIREINTNAGGCSCIHRHKCWGLFWSLTPMLGVIIVSTDTSTGGYYCIY